MSATTIYTEEVIPQEHKSVGKGVDTATLVRMLQSKQEQGFYILYDRYCGALYGVLMKLVHRHNVADDLLQDVFVKIWKNIDAYDPARGALFTWMLNITRNQAIDYLRSSRHQQELLHVDYERFTLHREYEAIDAPNNCIAELKDLRNKTMQLDAKYAEVIDMIYFYGFTQEQTAGILKIPLGTVKTRARKGLSILKVIYLQ